MAGQSAAYLTPGGLEEPAVLYKLMIGRTRRNCGTPPRRRAGWKAAGRLLLLPSLEVEVAYEPRAGWRIRRWRRRAVNGSLPGPWIEPLGRQVVNKRQVRSITEAGGPVAQAATKTLGKFPHLIAHCNVTRYADNTPRKPGWVTIQVRGDEWEVVVKDPDSGAKLVARSVALDDALQLAQELLSAEDTLWEPDPYLAPKKGKKR